jgi:ABC-type lipoprotein release transport system permease subunit
LHGVSPTDPLTYLAGAIFLLLIACAACLVPAWRAASVDPSSALCSE